MREKIRILVLSTNPWTGSRTLVDGEAREIFERLQEGPYRDKFQLHNHAATRASDLQKLLLMYEPHIVHFSGRGSQRHRVDQQALANVFALYNKHVRLVLLNASFPKAQVRSISEVINYSIGTGKGTGDKVDLTFAGAFYRALAFGKSIRGAFASAQAELTLTRMPRSRGIELFVRHGVSERDRFPRTVRPARRRDPLRRLYQGRLRRSVFRRLRHVAP
jgi:hypothetical protein